MLPKPFLPSILQSWKNHERRQAALAPCRKSRNSRLILKTAYVANSYAKFPYMAQSQSTLRISEAQLRRRYFGTERALVILAVCTAFGAVFLLFGCLFMKAEQRSSKSGVLTMGKIIDKGRRSEDPGSLSQALAGR